MGEKGRELVMKKRKGGEEGTKAREDQPISVLTASQQASKRVSLVVASLRRSFVPSCQRALVGSES